MTSRAATKQLTREELSAKIAALPDGAKKAAMQKFAIEKYKKVHIRSDKFKPFQFAPEQYIEQFLKWKPWSGLDDKHPGQLQILKACSVAIELQLEKRAFEKSEIVEKDLKVWKPGQTIQNWIRVESGNGVGKTKILSGSVQWFVDCFDSVVYTFHTSAMQDQLTTWAEIGQDRTGKGLPGRLLTTKIDISHNRFAVSRSPSDSGGMGEENTKGKHKEFLFFVIDEADGAKNFIFNAIETMLSGGIGCVLMTANPRSRASKFHRLKKLSYVKTLRISSLYHPNVVEGKEVIPGAVTRGFVEKEIEKGCQVVKIHDDENFTFDLPYDVQVGEMIHPAKTIFKPSHEFMTRILGIAPPTSLDKTIVSVGVYEAACKRVPVGGDVIEARVGVDAARSGADKGTVYIRWQDAVWRSAELGQADTYEYVDAIKTECLKLKEKGATSLHIRVDAGYGSGVIDALRIDGELKEAFKDFQVFEVHFGGRAYNTKDYDNLATEMYYETAESLKSLCIISPPEPLEIDLTEREFKFINRMGKTKKILEPKDDFKKRTHRSPDDGDGLVMAVAPDYCFNNVNISVMSSGSIGQSQVNTTSAVEDLAKILGL